MIRKFKEAVDRFRDYIYDPSINIKERSFILFSILVLIAIFTAVPCGLVMKEPLSATFSTLLGALFFTLYIIHSFRKNRIKHAKIVISVILVFIFLPAMFFTNGGVNGGTPIWLLLGTVYIVLILEGKFRVAMLISDFAVVAASLIVGYLFPDLVTEYSRSGNYLDTFFALLIVGSIIYILFSFHNNILLKEEERKNVKRLFEQTAVALVNAIDAKDRYTHGHSSRVAEYSRKIAELSGKSERECEEIYYVALLHDVGKIGISEAIINKEGKLTPEEYSIIKLHPVLGGQILHSISEYPNLIIGANYHHERYDGKGYPRGLKGTDIPEYARIISVADAYDAMTSKRSYRDPIPQQKVREEFVKGAGTQFDPDFARIMLHMIDMDSEYKMQEWVEARDLSVNRDLIIDKYRSDVSEGIQLTPFYTHVSLSIVPNREDHACRPEILLFDSMDGRYHDNEFDIKDMDYYEYGEIFFDGNNVTKGARKIKTTVSDTDPDSGLKDNEYRITAIKCRDHALVRITGKEKTLETIVALPDNSRFAYMSFTGENCRITDIFTEKSDERGAPEHIPRIADEINYIDVPAGDIPNVQIDGYRTATSEGIKVTDGLKITFHAQSLPMARLVWHCPYITVFSGEDGSVYSKDFKEYILSRLDGECWEGCESSSVEVFVNRGDAFGGWERWKAFNKAGFDCTITFERSEDKITIRTENFGISIKDVVTTYDGIKDIYVALTGDQCAITNIKVSGPDHEQMF